MNDCLNCDEHECYECWLMSDKPEAEKFRAEVHAAHIEAEYKKIFGEVK